MSKKKTKKKPLRYRGLSDRGIARLLVVRDLLLGTAKNSSWPDWFKH